MPAVVWYFLAVPLAYWAITVIYGIVFETLPLIPKYIIRKDFEALCLLVPLMAFWSIFLCWMVFPGIVAEYIREKSY